MNFIVSLSRNLRVAGCCSICAIFTLLLSSSQPVAAQLARPAFEPGTAQVSSYPPGTPSASPISGVRQFRANTRMASKAGAPGIKASSVADPVNFTATPANLTSILLQWQKNASNNNVMIASNTFFPQLPVDGTIYSPGDIIPGGGIVIYSGPGTSYTHTGLQQGNYYAYRAWSYTAAHAYSTGVDAYSYTCSPPVTRFAASNLTPQISEAVSLEDHSDYLPVTWLWQFSPSTVTFLNGTNAGSQNPVVAFTAAGSYSVALTVINAWGTNSQTKTNYITAGPPAYCTPTYVYGTASGDYISLVQLGSIDYASNGAPDPYYTYNSSMSTDLIPGNDYTVTLSPGTYADDNNLTVWIDYNHDLFFSPDEKLGCILVAPSPATGTISFTVPFDALTGITRMRVREVWLGSDVDACSLYYYGETEDFNVNIQTPYCTPTYDYGTLYGDYISLVQLGDIDNETGFPTDPPYYTYFSEMSTDLMPGENYSITLSPGLNSLDNWFHVWIDYNHDQVFGDDELIGDLYLAEAPSAGTIEFTVPAGAIYGNTRMRVREINGLEYASPCGNFGGGETEDYNVNILNPYCVPWYNQGSIEGDYISLVSLAGINNATGALDSPYYKYYNNLSTELGIGENFTLTVSAGTVENNNYISAWIDFNRNLLFEPEEKLGVVSLDATPATGTISFSIPETVDPGPTRLRVREVFGESDFDDCSTYEFGETEDYNVKLVTSYCIPTYVVGTAGGDYISLVQLGSINNSTDGSGSPFYTYYSNLSTDLARGIEYTITLSPGTYSDHNNMEVFIDFNQNRVFEETEMLGNILVDPTPSTGTISFTVPSDAVTGTTRMRVREVWANGNFDACSQYEYGETEDYNVNIISSARTLDLLLYVEALWNGSSLNKAQNESGDQYPGDVADKIRVELHSTTDYSQVQYIVDNVDLMVTGHATVLLPQNLTGTYYLTVKHRNSIETVSALPISFSSGNLSYDFSQAASSAYGDNQALHDGYFCLYGGDVNQDNIVDSGDMIPVDNLSSQFGMGYIPEDANGDGIIDSGDMILIDNNSNWFIGAMTP